MGMSTGGDIEHRLLQCPCVHPPDQPDARCVDLLHVDILEMVADDSCALAAIYVYMRTV